MSTLTKLEQQLRDLHTPVVTSKSVPVFDEFDSPYRFVTECAECRNGYWPCSTRILLDESLMSN